MPLIILPPLPTTGEDLLSEKTFSSIDDPYTLSTYAHLGSMDMGLDQGLMSTANGRLTQANLDDNFQLKDYHIQPEQASLARSESMLSSATIYGNGIPDIKDATNYFTVPGCSVRWYQPYETSVSLLQWSFFLSWNCWRGIYKDMEGEIHTRGVETPIEVRCRLDNTVVPASTRTLGQNMFHPISPGAVNKSDQIGPGVEAYKLMKITALNSDDISPTTEAALLGQILPELPSGSEEFSQDLRGGNPNYVTSEMHTATQFDLHHTTTLAKGYHEISVECLVKSPDGAGVYLQNMGVPGKTIVTGRGYFNLVGKVSFGIRNARVLNLL